MHFTYCPVQIYKIMFPAEIFILQNLIFRTKLCGTGFITQPSCVFDFNLTESVRKWFVLAVYQFWKGISAGPALKGGPEPLENEINKILGSKRQYRFSDHFSDLVQNICSFRFSYLLRLSIFCKAPRDMRKFPQKCQKDSRVLRERRLWFPTSDRLETWLISSGTTRSRQ